MTERLRANNKPQLLTAEQVSDPKYAEFVAKASEIQERTDFTYQAYLLFDQTHPDELLAEIQLSSGLQILLERERPATIFIDPNELAEVLPDKNIFVFYRPENIGGPSGTTRKHGFEQWRIGLNSNHDQNVDRNSVRLVLTRGNVPPIENEEPFLVVKYVANYSNGKITFVPEIKPTDDGGVIGNNLERLLLERLEIKGKTIDQELNFNVGDETVYIDMINYHISKNTGKTIVFRS